MQLTAQQISDLQIYAKVDPGFLSQMTDEELGYHLSVIPLLKQQRAENDAYEAGIAARATPAAQAAIQAALVFDSTGRLTDASAARANAIEIGIMEQAQAAALNRSGYSYNTSDLKENNDQRVVNLQTEYNKVGAGSTFNQAIATVDTQTEAVVAREEAARIQREQAAAAEALRQQQAAAAAQQAAAQQAAAAAQQAAAQQAAALRAAQEAQTRAALTPPATPLTPAPGAPALPRPILTPPATPPATEGAGGAALPLLIVAAAALLLS